MFNHPEFLAAIGIVVLLGIIRWLTGPVRRASLEAASNALRYGGPLKRGCTEAAERKYEKQPTAVLVNEEITVIYLLEGDTSEIVDVTISGHRGGIVISYRVGLPTAITLNGGESCPVPISGDMLHGIKILEHVRCAVKVPQKQHA